LSACRSSSDRIKVRHDPSDDPAILFLHGFPGTGSDWTAMISGARGQAVFAPDMPWIDTADEIGFADVPRQGMVWLSKLGPRPVHIVGHDLGGTVGWILAALCPDQVASLCAVASPHPTAYRDAATQLTAEGRRAYIAEILRSDATTAFHLPQGMTDDTPGLRLILERALARSSMQAVRGVYRTGISDAALSTPVMMPPVHCPVAMICGGRDEFFPQSLFDRSAALCQGPVRVTTLVDAGHFLHITHSAQVRAEMTQFHRMICQDRDQSRSGRQA
jgi:pimeloyl-ACP methyl ester carboxylesterase